MDLGHRQGAGMRGHTYMIQQQQQQQQQQSVSSGYATSALTEVILWLPSQPSATADSIHGNTLRCMPADTHTHTRTAKQQCIMTHSVRILDVGHLCEHTHTHLPTYIRVFQHTLFGGGTYLCLQDPEGHLLEQLAAEVLQHTSRPPVGVGCCSMQLCRPTHNTRQLGGVRGRQDDKQRRQHAAARLSNWPGLSGMASSAVYRHADASSTAGLKPQSRSPTVSVVQQQGQLTDHDVGAVNVMLRHGIRTPSQATEL
jgi:hypothetical protein